MRTALAIGVISFTAFAGICVASAYAQHYTGMSLASLRAIFVLASLGLLAGFCLAGFRLAGAAPSGWRVAASVAYSVVGSLASWVLGVNAGRLAAGMLGTPV